MLLPSAFTGIASIIIVTILLVIIAVFAKRKD